MPMKDLTAPRPRPLQTLTLLSTVEHLGKWMSKLALGDQHQRIFMSNADGHAVYPLASPHQAPVIQPSARYALPTYPNSLDTNPVDGSLFVSIKKKLHDDLSNDGNEHVARLVHPQ